MPRPKSDNPRSVRLHVALTQGESEALSELAQAGGYADGRGNGVTVLMRDLAVSMSTAESKAAFLKAMGEAWGRVKPGHRFEHNPDDHSVYEGGPKTIREFMEKPGPWKQEVRGCWVIDARELAQRDARLASMLVDDAVWLTQQLLSGRGGRELLAEVIKRDMERVELANAPLAGEEVENV